MKILFAWDFHGTLEKDNVKAAHEQINRVLSHFEIKRRISLKETIELYGLSWVDYFKYLCPDKDIKYWNQMRKKAMDLQNKEPEIIKKYIKPADYAKQVLSKIKEEMQSNIILTNTHPNWIKRFVEMVGLVEYFDDYIGLDLRHVIRSGKDISDIKFEALEKYLEKNKFDKIVKIGDRESDIKAGKLIGATTYYIRNEHNKNHIIKIKPDYEINDLREVLKEL